MAREIPRRTSEAADDQADERTAKKIDATDSRYGRIHDVKTDRGTFRFKDNRRDE